MTTKDLFSNHASQYSAFRPDYPTSLFDFLFDSVTGFEYAWDCGAGNGQAAKVLATRFTNVLATDISAKQMAMGAQLANIQYVVASAEQPPFEDNKFDLIVAAQAAHWFNLTQFFEQAKRVAKPGALIAIWGYNLLTISAEIDFLVEDFYRNEVGPFWDAERKRIDDAFKSIIFPFREVPCPPFEIVKTWNVDQLEGYLSTWSSVQKYMTAKGISPVPALMEKIRPLFGATTRTIRFPVFMRAGYVEKEVCGV